MTKGDLASYLVNLHFLMEAQRATGHQPSATIAADYGAGWAKLKDLITKEQTNEAGK